MSDQAGFNTQNSFCNIEQIIKQAFLNFQADLLPARSSSAQAQDSLSTPSSTSPLLSSPRQGIDKIYDLPCDFTLDFERLTLYPSVTMANPTNKLLSYAFDTIEQADSSYFCLPMGNTPTDIDRNQAVIMKENRRGEDSN